MIQTSVGKEDTAEGLYTFVESLIQWKGEPFLLKYLSPTNGRQVVIARDTKRLIQDLRFSAAELITFIWDEKASDDARLSRKTLAKEWEGKALALEVKEPVFEEKEEVGRKLGDGGTSEGKKKAGGGGGGGSGGDKESKLRNILGKGLFKR
jgi:tether containing UBX domain for GLUT4